MSNYGQTTSQNSIARTYAKATLPRRTETSKKDIPKEHFLDDEKKPVKEPLKVDWDSIQERNKITMEAIKGFVGKRAIPIPPETISSMVKDYINGSTVTEISKKYIIGLDRTFTILNENVPNYKEISLKRRHNESFVAGQNKANGNNFSEVGV